jgi:hypothetical protein
VDNPAESQYPNSKKNPNSNIQKKSQYPNSKRTLAASPPLIVSALQPFSPSALFSPPLIVSAFQPFSSSALQSFSPFLAARGIGQAGVSWLFKDI